jgi:hypothetical protein
MRYGASVCVTTAAPKEHPAGLFLHHLKPRLLRILRFGLLMALLNEFDERLHYDRANPAHCFKLLEPGLGFVGQGVEFLREPKIFQI